MPLSDGQREKVYKLVRDEPTYKPFFDYLAGLGHNTHESSLKIVQDKSGLNEQLSRGLMKRVEGTGLAAIKGGGNGVQNFLAWNEDVDVREVGRAYREPLR
jgi:hypothetical protein